MNYAPRNNITAKFLSSRAKRGLSAPVKVALGVAIVLAVLYLFLPRALPAFFLSLVHPLWKVETDARLGTASMEELREIYAEIVSNQYKTNALLLENEELKELIGRTTAGQPLLAAVLKKPPFSAYDSFILDAGSDLGVKKGQRVYALGSIPIGEIAEVSGNVSRAKLYSSAGEKFEVLIGQSNIEAAAVGKGGGHFEVSLPRDTKIMVGDRVLVPSLGDSFVGTVEGIASEPSEPFAKILFRQPVNIYEQRWVIIDTHDTF